MNDPLLAHIHVPKCAGTSVRVTLNQVFGPAHVNLYFLYTTFVVEEADLDEIIRRHQARAFSSHFVRTFPVELASRPIHYVTFLRDPVQQFLSYISYAKKCYSAVIADPVLLVHLPPNYVELSTRECARWILTSDTQGYRNFRENFTTNFFARYVVLKESGYGYSDPRYRRIRLDVAKERLSRFLFVGITEHMEESWSAMCRACANAGIEIPKVDLPIENQSFRSSEDVDWVHERDEIGRLLLDSVREDQALYNAAKERFEQAIQTRVTQL